MSFLYYLLFFLENDIERLKRRIESLVRSNDEKVINIYNYQTVYFLHTIYKYHRKEKLKIYKVKYLNTNPLLCHQYQQQTELHQ